MIKQNLHNTIFNYWRRIFIASISLSTAIQLTANTEPVPDSLNLLQTYIQKYKQGLETETQHDSTHFYLIKAQNVAVSLGRDSLLAEIKASYAYFIKGRGKLAEAQKVLSENVRYAQQKQDSFLLMRTYMEMGNGYFPFIDKSELSLDTLIFYTEKGLIIAKNRKDVLHTLIAQQNLAAHYQYVPNLKNKALTLLLETIELTDQHPEGIYFKAPAYRDLATYYLDDKKYRQAIDALQKSIEFGKAHESYGSLMMAHEDLQQIYETLGDYKQSLAAYKTAAFYREKLKNQEVDKEIAAQEVAFEAERKEQQINQLRLKNAQEKERSKRQQTLLWSLLIGGSLVGFLTYLAYKNNQKKQQALLQLAANQKELANFKTRFYTNLTHEFRTPLTVIQGMTDRILGNPEPKEMIQRNSEYLLNLVNQMLDLQKLDEGALRAQNIQTDLISYARYLIEPFSVLAKNKSIHLTIYDENKELLMDFDPNFIKQILDNLLSNAIKFTPEGGEILVHLKKVNHQFQLKVKDSGIGIEQDQLPYVFDRFYQVSPTNRQQSVGTGIGLALAKELVERMQGQIDVESQPLTGTIFTVLLPIQNKAPLQNPKRPERIHQEKIALQKGNSSFNQSLNQAKDQPNLLIIEDNPDVLKFLELTLKDHYQLVTATNGKIGITKALDTIPDLIISDIMMPEVDGLELCKTLKKDERSSHIPIILLTAKTTKTDQIEGLAEGADAYLTKPFDAKELLIRIEKLLENRRKLQAYYLQWNPYQPKPKTQPNKESTFLLKVKNIIDQNLANENFGVLQLCHALHLSRMQVHRKLKAVCNKSTAQFIREIRLQKANDLLKTTDSTIAEIAYSVGFADPNYFSKVFSDFFGYLPSVTRK